MGDVSTVGGKNASLGEMIQNLSSAGIRVPPGFATTAESYRHFLKQNGLDSRIMEVLSNLQAEDTEGLVQAGAKIRQWIEQASLSPQLEKDIRSAYERIVPSDNPGISVAVRSSATAEDLPEASFAGQQETFLNVNGITEVLTAVKSVYASLYNDRAISYRIHQGFDHSDVALSVGIQRMVRSDIGASGVVFSIDTESGFDQAVLITSAYGLGECLVQGAVNPDEFYVYKKALAEQRPAILRRTRGTKLIKMIYDDRHAVKTVDVPIEEQRSFSLTDEEVQSLARMAVTIEHHYGCPMDIEWAKDGQDGQLYILQARPETVESRTKNNVIQRYQLNSTSEVLVQGRAIGQRIGAGTVRVVKDIGRLSEVQPGDILVTDMTDPDWEPVMKKASAIVTNRGGRTCHAAIIARELGVPAVVGCGDATTKLKGVETVTVSCAEGEMGKVYNGQLDYNVEEIDLDSMPPIPFEITMNVGNPDRCFDFQRIPNHGVGLARLEFIISNSIGVHPKALLNYTNNDEQTKALIEERAAGYADPIDFYVKKLSEGIATLGAAFAPQKVIVRLSDFKSNEYANMIGGLEYEPQEENPMIGFRGASRYVSESFRDCFELECKAIKYVRDEMGLGNIWIMVPFVRTLGEADQVIELLRNSGLESGKNDLKIIMMCEIPSNALLAEEFLSRFDGFSIGSNDLTQLCLGLDRDSGLIAQLFDERDKAVKSLLHMAIKACNKLDKYVGICGQGPSDHPDLARWLMDEGIDSVSLNPDSVIETWLYLAGKEI